MKLKRMQQVLLEAIPEHAWESRAVFNPGVVRDGDIIHILYRAVEGANFSTLGYAKLDRQCRVLERRPDPVLNRLADYEQKGCEDARIVEFENIYYIFYTGYDGQNVRVCVASTVDFKTFHRHGVIIPDIQNKDAMIFPERINGQVVLILRVEPNIQFAYFNSIEALLSGDKTFWQNYLPRLEKHTVMRPEFDWEEEKIGAGPPPIKTPEGWLLIYHGVDKNLVYRAGVALLDLDNPARVIARLPEPILEPEMPYECTGDVPNVVFPEGTALFDDELLVFYGGADKVVAGASVNINQLLAALKKVKP